MEKIKSINETTWGDRYSQYEGYEIITSKQTIRVGISSGQSCCENFGYLTTNDNLQDFIGANLRAIKIVDQALKIVVPLSDLYEGGAMFVNFETSKGVMQLVAYNSHNGYYGHEAVLISQQLNETASL